MTKEEILKVLKENLKWQNYTDGNDSWDTELKEAVTEAVKLIEQQPGDDVMAIHTQGLDEGIRCAMCTNSMKNDRGCDGGCVVNEDMYKKVMDTINNQMFNQPTSEDCVSRENVRYMITGGKYADEDYEQFIDRLVEELDNMPPVTPTRKGGLHWIERFNDTDKWLECPHCHKDRHFDEMEQLFNKLRGE